MELSVKKMIVMAFLFPTLSWASAGHEWGNGALNAPLRCQTVNGLFHAKQKIYPSAVIERRDQTLYLSVFNGIDPEPIQKGIYSYRNVSMRDGLTVFTTLQDLARREFVWLYAGVEGLISHDTKGDLFFYLRFVTDSSRTYTSFKCTELPKE